MVTAVAVVAMGFSVAQASAATASRTGMRVDTGAAGVDGTVTVRAKVHAPTVRVLDELVVAVRGTKGEQLDFPAVKGAEVGPNGYSWTSRRQLPPGTYVAFVRYRAGDRWHDLRPQRSFTVRRPAGTAPPSMPPSSAPPSTAPPAVPSAGPSGPKGTGWKKVFDDEFSGQGLDRSKWADTSSAESDGGHGNLKNQQLEWNQAANCTVADGHLTMTAKRTSFTSPSGQHYDWTSCLLTSTPSLQLRYGYIEERSKLPAAKGFWPAFWTWQANGVDTWVDTDVYEFYSDNHTKLYLSQHSSQEGCEPTPGFDPTSGFHTYAADIEPEGTTFYLDGKQVCRTKGTSAGSTNLITNLAVYSKIPPDAATTTATKVVDWVRAWQR